MTQISFFEESLSILIYCIIFTISPRFNGFLKTVYINFLISKFRQSHRFNNFKIVVSQFLSISVSIYNVTVENFYLCDVRVLLLYGILYSVGFSCNTATPLFNVIPPGGFVYWTPSKDECPYSSWLGACCMIFIASLRRNRFLGVVCVSSPTLLSPRQPHQSDNLLCRRQSPSWASHGAACKNIWSRITSAANWWRR
jgi:hypothetical protein